MSSTRSIVHRHQTSDSSLAAPSPSTMSRVPMGSRAKERVLHAAHNDASLIGSLTAESGCPPVP